MNPVEAYLQELRDIRASGATVPETSGYGALATLLTEVGDKLKPKVRCTHQPGQRRRRHSRRRSVHGQPVSQGRRRAAVRPAARARGHRGQADQSDDAHAVARSEQVRRYLEKYRQVLVTTYREFVLVGYDLDGEAQTLESFSLAPQRSRVLGARRASGQRRRPGGRRAPHRVPAPRHAAPGAHRLAARPRLVSRQLRPRGASADRGARPARARHHAQGAWRKRSA